ncbi:MAG TPA: tetratricopeptide repeat protein [Chitinophagaceae bacterium]|nr:tetratricopeptide repeat protein [Chitinophagaceae bacterium]
MSEKKHAQPDLDPNELVIAKARDFWTRFNKPIMIVCGLIIVLGGGYLAYKYLYLQPQEEKAAEYMYKAEDYYRMDSIKQALNGDGLNAGFLKVISKYGSTSKGNLARFYAGDCYLKLGDNANAVKYLKEFSTGSRLLQARAYKLLADAYADQGKNADALDNYKKAAHYFEKDDVNSPEYLFLAAYFADKVMKDSKQAIGLYQELKEKYPNTEKGFEADKYLAQLGVYKSE